MGKPKFTKEERELMNYTRAATPVTFYIAAGAITSIIPIVLFSTVLVLNPVENAILYIALAAVSTFALSFAYQNTARRLKDGVAKARSQAVREVVLAQYREQKKTNKDAPVKDVDTMVSEKQSEVAEVESKYLALSWNNALFSVILVVMSFYLFRSFSSQFNYGLSVATTSILVALFSTGS